MNPNVILTHVQGLLQGMQLGCTLAEAWLVSNGAIIAWNTYLPILHQQRYAELAGVLLPLLQNLLKVR